LALLLISKIHFIRVKMAQYIAHFATHSQQRSRRQPWNWRRSVEPEQKPGQTRFFANRNRVGALDQTGQTLFSEQLMLGDAAERLEAE
jgi:hypothetical protein